MDPSRSGRPSRPEKLASYLDPRIARDYDRRWSGAAGRRRDRRKGRALARALEHLGRTAGQPVRTVLDVPCGTARFARRLGGLGYHWTGVDLSAAMLGVGGGKSPGARLVSADLARLPFGAGAFDAVICIRLMHLIRDGDLRLAFLGELRRVARLGVVVGYHHGHTLRVWGRHLRHRLGLLERAPANPGPRAILSEVRAAGFRDLAWCPVRFAPLLSDKVLVVAR